MILARLTARADGSFILSWRATEVWPWVGSAGPFWRLGGAGQVYCTSFAHAQVRAMDLGVRINGD